MLDNIKSFGVSAAYILEYYKKAQARNYFYLVYTARTVCGDEVVGNCNIRINKPMFNKQLAFDYIMKPTKKGYILDRDTLVITNWKKFNSKEEYDIFNLDIEGLGDE